MLYPKIEDAIKQIGCKYTLTIVAAKRAKDLSMKMPANFANSRRKEITYALGEAANGKLEVTRITNTSFNAS